MKGRASDERLFPAKLLAPGSAQGIIQEGKQEGKKVNSMAIAEKLIQGLNASNRLNELWVR